MEIKYDTEIEVNATQYDRLLKQCDGIIAYREKDGKFYIKVWHMEYADYVKKVAGF